MSRQTLALLSLCGLAACLNSHGDSAGELTEPRPRATRLATMPLSRADATVDADGVRLSRANGGAIRLQLSAWGREDAPRALTDAELLPAACAPEQPDCLRRMERVHPGLTEWWVGVHGSLEQGFTIHERPLGELERVGFSLSVQGALLIETDGQSAWILDEEGEEWTVGGLAAWDARGRALPTHFESEAGTLRLIVEDEGAVYPVTVDPVYATYFAQITPPSNYAGMLVVGLGDVNGDGYDDVALGAAYDNNGDGAVYVYKGSSSGLRFAWTLTGSCISGQESFGYAVAGGDVNGDGYSDIVIGAPDCTSQNGKIYTYLGNSRTTPSLASTNGSILGSTDEELGASVAVGDLNGDGLADIVAGAPGYSSDIGRVKVVITGGAQSTLMTSYTQYIVGGSARFGTSVTIAPDLNGDGYPEVVAGGPYYQNGFAEVIYDARNGTLSASHTRLTGGSSSEDFGWTLAGVGDLDGDGYGDLVVGSSGNGSGAGRLSVFRGASSAISTTAASTLTSTASSSVGYALAPLGDIDADAHPDFAARSGITGQLRSDVLVFSSGGSSDLSAMSVTTVSLSNSGFGVHVGGAGDVDGDGYDDLLVSECVFTCTAVYLYLGYADVDGDGFVATEDCDDNDPSVYPGATELPDNGQDDDCDGFELCAPDADGDGYSGAGTLLSADLDCADAGEHGQDGAAQDCDDTRADVHPGATEITGDNLDSDCDGLERCFLDEDGDGYRGELTWVSADPACAEPGLATAGMRDGDCDDSDPAINPDATESVGDGVDQDCDGHETCFVDADQDGVRPLESAAVVSEDADCDDPGEAKDQAPFGDCDDNNPAIFPGATELPADGIDADCDGAELCFTDADGDGVTDPVPVLSLDSDCLDAGEYGLGTPSGDCDDGDAAVYPGAEEQADDGVDQDCDGEDQLSAPPAEKGCSTVGTSGSLGLLALLGLMLLRRQ